jgi:alpha-beta hydrolase superfamily lysophospholipase
MPALFSRLVACRRRLLRTLLLVLTVVTICWLGVSAFIGYRLTHRAVPIHAEPVPILAGMTMVELRLHTRDGQDLGAWWVPGRDGVPVVLLLHGNGGGRSPLSPEVGFLHDHGCGILLISLRAHGDSTGEVNDMGYSARLDVVAAVDWLRAQAPRAPLFIHGQSLGGAAALFAAEELADRVDGYILEAVYPDLWTAVHHRTRLYLPLPFAVALDAGLWVVAPVLLPDIGKIAPIEAARKVPPHIPVLLMADGQDQRATVMEQCRIARNIASHPCVFVFPDAGHLMALRSQPVRYRKLILGFIDHPSALDPGDEATNR